MTATRPFLDTNIFLYSLDRSDERKSTISNELIDKTIATQSGFMSYQVIQELIGAALKKFPRSMSAGESERYFLTVFSRFNVVHSSLTIFLDAIKLQERFRLSWWNSLIVASAIEVKCTILYTEDLQHGQRLGELVVTTPFS